MQLPFSFEIPRLEWSPPSLGDLPSWADARRICIDVETKDPDIRDLGPGTYRPGNHVCGVSFAIEDGPAHYLPLRHEGGDNVDCERALQYLREQARVFRGTVVGANLNYDLGFLDRDDVVFSQTEWFRDVQHAAVLIYELYEKYGLDAIAARYNLPGKDSSILDAYAKAYRCHPKRDLYRLPGRAVAQYAIQDVRLPLQILRKQEREIEDLDIQSIWDLESRVLPVLVKMRKRGVRVNLQKVERIERWALTQETDLLERVHHRTGVRVNVGDVWKADAMARPLRALGVQIPMTAGTEKKGPSISIKSEWLEQQGEVGEWLARAREFNKLRTTFCARTREYAIDGRVHCVLHQLRKTKDDGDGDDKGARYGRFSSEHYNIQQEPARDDEFGPLWRSVYEPELGTFWVCSDWSQQEPRWGVHYAELLGLPGARSFADQYRSNPYLDIHQALADLSGIARKIVKNFVNGRLYGMGDAKLCRSIKRPTKWIQGRDGKPREVPGEEGQAIIDRFNQYVPWLVLLTREAAKRAKAVGHVWTWLRRRCNFPKDSQGNYDWSHKAFSRIGQGTAADQMKATLVEADKAGIPLQLAVHDEYDYSETDYGRMRLLRELQMDVVRANVPMMVDQEVGTSWGTVQKWDVFKELRN